jgi:hypothetical protein
MPRSAAKNAPPAKSVRGNPETILQGKIMESLGLLPGVVPWRNAVGTAVYEGGARVEYGVGGRGAPDLFCTVLFRGLSIALYLEVKTPEGSVDPHQRQWHSAARRGGNNVAVIRSVADALAVVAEVQTHGRVVGAWEVSS